MNRFFVNNEGIRFDAGLIEVSLAKEPDIEECVIVPKYDKGIHDTVPALYIRTKQSGAAARDTVRQALYHVFVTDRYGEKTNIPNRCVICKELPHNQAGKANISRIMTEGTEGNTYAVVSVRRDGKVNDVKLLSEKAAAMNPGTLPTELEHEFKTYTLPMQREMSMLEALKGRGKNSGSSELRNRMPMMGCNPDRQAEEDGAERRECSFADALFRPVMGCNPGRAIPDHNKDRRRRTTASLLIRPLMGCNPMRTDEDEDGIVH